MEVEKILLFVEALFRLYAKSFFMFGQTFTILTLSLKNWDFGFG